MSNLVWKTYKLHLVKLSIIIALAYLCNKYIDKVINEY